MEELNDKDFDQIFKKRIADGYLEYDEASWRKMEEKLRRRDRFVFLRNASIILLFLSFGLGIYLIGGEGEALVTKEIKTAKTSKKASFNKIEKVDALATALKPSNNKKPYSLRSKHTLFTAKPEIIVKPIIASISKPTAAIESSTPIAQNPVNPQVAQASPASPTPTSISPQPIGAIIDEKATLPQKQKRPIALSILVGPDFSSTENTIGGKSGMTVGIAVSVPLGKKLSVQTGVNYGSKNYEAKGYDYTFNNPNTIHTIAGIDASCKVLEIPLLGSYTLVNTQKSSINLNAGLSSYLMLKENYRFIYTEASGRKDRFLEENNSNQHYLSVIDLSATYNIKLKNKKFALGLQPYLKIPISGIGEGSVPLKSSGVSLKLNYELIKKR